MVMARMATMCIIWSAADGAPTGAACAYTASSMDLLLGLGRGALVRTVPPPELALVHVEGAAIDGLARLLHECLVKRHVVQGQHSVREDLAGLMQMAQV